VGKRPAVNRRLGSLLHRRWVYETSYALLVLGATALILSIIGREAGWPIGSSFTEEFIYVSLYAAHFRHLDFFPVWSSSDAFGLGSPALLFYQKAFFYVSGVIFILLGGAMKPTLIATIGIFLVIGAYGMRRALELVTEVRLLQVVGSVGFLFTNYVFTDWLVRGDLPEFSAMMIVPWLLFWCLNLVKNRRVSLLLIAIVPLLVDGHSAIGLVSLFTLAVAFVTFVITTGWSGLRSAAPRLAVAVGGAAVLLAPTLLAELRFTQYFDPASKVKIFDEYYNNFRPLGSYFFDGTFRWLAANDHDFVQIDFAIWIPIAVAIIALVVVWIASRRRPDRTLAARGVNLPSVAVLLVSLSIYLFLQMRISLFLWHILWPLQATDFPSRMLAFITPIGVVLVVVIADYAIVNYRAVLVTRCAAVLWLVSLIVLSPLTSTWSVDEGPLATPGSFPRLEIWAPPPYLNYRTFTGLATFNELLFPEYLPKVYDSNGELSDDVALYRQLHQRHYGAASLSSVPCTVDVPSKSPLESLDLTFRVACAGATRLALPVTINAYSTVYVRTDDGTLHRIPYFHARTDPRMIIDVHGSRPEVVVVHLPTLWGILG
jgi:hypothetical protein